MILRIKAKLKKKNDIAYIINIMPREGSGFDPRIVPDFDLLL